MGCAVGWVNQEGCNSQVPHSLGKEGRWCVARGLGIEGAASAGVFEWFGRSLCP